MDQRSRLGRQKLTQFWQTPPFNNDNDAGWFPDVINRLGDPGVVRRVPRYLYESVQRVTPEMLRESVTHDPMAGTVHLVAARAYVGYELRRQALLANLRRMIARYGEAAVLAWP